VLALVAAVVDELPAAAAPERQRDLLVVLGDLHRTHVGEHGAGDDLRPAEAGSDPQSVPVSRRGRTNSSPVLRSACSTASSPSSSPMKVSSEVIQLIE